MGVFFLPPSLPPSFSNIITQAVLLPDVPDAIHLTFCWETYVPTKNASFNVWFQLLTEEFSANVHLGKQQVMAQVTGP